MESIPVNGSPLPSIITEMVVTVTQWRHTATSVCKVSITVWPYRVLSLKWPSVCPTPCMPCETSYPKWELANGFGMYTNTLLEGWYQTIRIMLVRLWGWPELGEALTGPSRFSERWYVVKWWLVECAEVCVRLLQSCLLALCKWHAFFEHHWAVVTCMCAMMVMWWCRL